MTNFDDDIRRISVLVNDLGDGRDIVALCIGVLCGTICGRTGEGR
jgi:hypothetical protein